MFITKKHIPRRTFLRGAGVTLALPCWTRCCRRRRLCRKTAANAEDPLRRHLLSARHGAGLLGSEDRRHRLRILPSIMTAARTVPRSAR